MKTSFLLRGLGGLLASLFGGLALIGALWVGIFVTMNYDSPRFAVHVPGAIAQVGAISAENEITAVFSAFFILAMGLILLGLYQLRAAFFLLDEDAVVLPIAVEDRLDELERLKRRDMVTPAEYAAKRQEILKDL